MAPNWGASESGSIQDFAKRAGPTAFLQDLVSCGTMDAQMTLLKPLKIAGLLLLTLLGVMGCATPQEKAIAAHCRVEAARVIPQQMSSQQVMRPFRVGERVIGYRNSCRTVTRDGTDDKGNPIKIRDTLCRDDPIFEPVYEQRLVTEVVDLNQTRRLEFERACSTEALAKGLFADLK